MPTFNGPVDAMHGLLDFLIDRTAPLPQRLRDRLRAAVKDPSPVSGMIGAIEAVYALHERRGTVAAEMREWAASAADVAGSHGFGGFAADDRGMRMARRLRGQAVAQVPTVADGELQIVDPSAANLEPIAPIEPSTQAEFVAAPPREPTVVLTEGPADGIN